MAAVELGPAQVGVVLTLDNAGVAVRCPLVLKKYSTEVGLTKVLRQAAAESKLLLQMFGSSLPTSAAGMTRYRSEYSVSCVVHTPC